ncbi:hypothetical protein ACL9RF_09800 [Sphingobacterium sp. Mn56C]|uniref:hypothetical protein n=1 Tax=Sphingobacterium sp. Mn56C TaxID=3395261 RepID=UPI003BC1815C
MEIKRSTTDKIASHEKKDNSKIYFFVIAIAALLLTNVYFYIKFKSSGEKLYTVALQKENLQIEIDRIEAELDNIKQNKTEVMPAAWVEDEAAARKAISDLRTDLDRSNISDKSLQEARDKVQGLKSNVFSLKNELNELRLQNEILSRENSKLNTSVQEKDSQLKVLKESNTALTEKVDVASSIKVSSIFVNGVDRNRKGELELETKAKRIQDLQIRFTIADNPLAKEGSKDVFIRIINPQGNLIAESANVFYVHGDKLQFTKKETINFTNKGEEYQFLWRDKDKFQKGAYTVLLYADDAIMGRSSIILK